MNNKSGYSPNDDDSINDDNNGNMNDEYGKAPNKNFN